MKNLYTIASLFMWLIGMVFAGLIFMGTGADLASTIGALAVFNVLALGVVAICR